MSRAEIQFWSIREGAGPVAYDRAHELRKELVELRAQELIPDTILFLEHEPVITRGRGLQFDPGADPGRPRQMPLPPMIPNGIAARDIERGGDLTFHEPGQLVIYPVCRLGDPRGFAPERDIARFLRRFEDIVIDLLRELGLPAGPRENATGVWVGRANLDAASGSPQDLGLGKNPGKIASMGIAVRRWVTYHGMAINVVNALDGFRLISPCGFAPEVMVKLADLVPKSSSLHARFTDGTWRDWLERKMARRMAQREDAVVSIRGTSPMPRQNFFAAPGASSADVF